MLPHNVKTNKRTAFGGIPGGATVRWVWVGMSDSVPFPFLVFWRQVAHNNDLYCLKGSPWGYRIATATPKVNVKFLFPWWVGSSCVKESLTHILPLSTISFGLVTPEALPLLNSFICTWWSPPIHFLSDLFHTKGPFAPVLTEILAWLEYQSSAPHSSIALLMLSKHSKVACLCLPSRPYKPGLITAILHLRKL